MKKNVVISLSGGMDSSTLLLRCLSEYDQVTAISFDYGQKHRVELERAQSLVSYLNSEGHFIKYQVIKLDGLVNLLNSNLVEGGDDVPEGHYAEENMKATVVPNRNKIFASLVQAVALSEANANGNDTDIALGIHAGDHAIYPDCRQEFRSLIVTGKLLELMRQIFYFYLVPLWLSYSLQRNDLLVHHLHLLQD